VLATESARLPSVALRLPGVLGRGAHRAWIPTLIERMKMGCEVTIYNPDGPFNNALHADDLTVFIGELLLRPWTGFHAIPIGADGAMQVREVVAKLLTAARSTSRVAIAHSSLQPFTISSAYAIEHFGYRPTEIHSLLDRYTSELD
jgi:nucleoside-diphosphate-sugar epimerase